MCDFGGGIVKEGGDNDPSSNLPPKVRNRISSVDDDDGGPDSIDIGPHFPLSRGDELSVFRVILTILLSRDGPPRRLLLEEAGRGSR